MMTAMVENNVHRRRKTCKIYEINCVCANYVIA